MVDCMNASGIDYVCIGNHEADISMSNFHNRIKQSHFKWLNSNMPGLSIPADLKHKVSILFNICMYIYDINLAVCMSSGARVCDP